MLKDWKEKTTYMKVLAVIGTIVSISIIVLALLQLFNVYDKADYVFMPALGILMIIQGLQYWNKSRWTSIFSFVTSIFIFFIYIIRLIGR